MHLKFVCLKLQPFVETFIQLPKCEWAVITFEIHFEVHMTNFSFILLKNIVVTQYSCQVSKEFIIMPL